MKEVGGREREREVGVRKAEEMSRPGSMNTQL